MVDPLAEVVGLLQPGAPFAKVSSGAGLWRLRRTEVGRFFYGVVLEGACRLTVDDQPPMLLLAGDFILIPSLFQFTMTSLEPPPAEAPDTIPIEVGPGRYWLGAEDGPPDVRSVVGYCTFGSPDANLLVSLLPRSVHVRGEPRLATLVQLVSEEARAQRPAREVVLSRLLEVMLIEALRSSAGTAASPGLLRGLADDRLAAAIRAIHQDPARAWTVPDLAAAAALSRSAFFERFRRAVGVPPMEYVLAWRMALAKDLLRRGDDSVAEVAEQVGYSSASTFSVAFARHVGQPPTRWR